MKDKKKTVWKIILILSIILIICALGYVCWYMFSLYSSGQEYNKIKPTESITSEKSTELPSDGDTPDAPPDNVAPSEVHDTVNGGINFSALWEINTDLYAWIKIPNTAIDYPIAQYPGEDDTYYLNHNMYKESAFAGCIYTEKLNSKDFTDPNTVLYGHNMQNGTMFRALHNFRDKDFFDQNQYIYVYLPDKTLTYQIFSAYEYDDRHLLYSFDFTNKEVFQEYLNYAQNPTSSMMYNTRDLNVTTDDKIITLSTCLGDIETSRYLVQGVLIKDEPAKQ